jgi:RimJ/RimL family protein N-acetyltransferase
MMNIGTKKISLGSYSVECLEKSWLWLNDSEVRNLTMTPEFSREDQLRFFESLSTRTDYLIWAVELDGAPIGAAGLKNHRKGIAEYWGYIGEKDLWGRGLGSSILTLVQDKAKEFKFSSLDLKVLKQNTRAVSLYTKCGFIIDEGYSSDGVLRMIKRDIR